MDYPGIVEQVRTIAQPILDEFDAELVDVTFRYESLGLVLRLLVDKPGAVTVDECAEVNQRLSFVLDEAKIIEKRYILEVSSPGLDRPLSTKRDFERAVGALVRVTTQVPIADSNTNIGFVKEALDDKVVIETKSGFRLEIPLGKIEKAVREIEF